MRSLDKCEESLQRRSLAGFLWLLGRQRSWSSRLVMLSASDRAAGLAMATLAAGGAVLWVCPDEAAMRASGLGGLSDFQVTTLSESLRILKNEIRKGQSVSVAVPDVQRTVWTEAVARGLQPAMLAADPPNAASAAVLCARGAAQVRWTEAIKVQECSSWVEEQQSSSWRERREGDAALLAGLSDLPEDDRGIAEQWLRAAPRLFPRDLVRCYATAWTASKSKG